MYEFIMPIFPYLLGILGLIVGSFLNVVILRQQKNMTLGGRSHCPHCKTTLKWYELIPVVSFLIQLGRCRTCRTKISLQYIGVELLTGILFFGMGSFLINSLFVEFLSLGFFTALFGLIATFSFAICIIVFDVKTKTVPLNWFLGLVISSIVYLLGIYNFQFSSDVIFSHITGIIVAVPFFAIWIFSEGRVIGFADIEIMAWIGLFFGVMAGISTILVAFYVGAIMSLLFVFYKLARGFTYSQIRTIQIPFTPFLITAWFGALLFSWNIFSLFARLFL